MSSPAHILLSQANQTFLLYARTRLELYRLCTAGTLVSTSNLTYIITITSTASRQVLHKVFFLKKNIETKHQGIPEAVYKTTVRSQVEYALSVWSPYTINDIHKVEMVQRRATCLILSSYSPYQSVTELQQQLNPRTLERSRVDA